MRHILALGVLGCAMMASQAQTPQVICQVGYGGQTQVVIATPTETPYQVPATEIGSYFRFRIVFRATPPDLASIKLYTQANLPDGPSLIYQATYAYPLANANVHDFTGEQTVYEPRYGTELRYRCALQAEMAK